MTPDDLGMWAVAILIAVVVFALVASVVGLAVLVWRAALREGRE